MFDVQTSPTFTLGPVTEDEQLAERVERLVQEGSLHVEVEPNRRLRMNLVRNTKGINHDTTLEIDGQLSPEALYEAMDQLDLMACELIIRGVQRREAIDRGEYESALSLATKVEAAPEPAHSAESIDELPF